MRCPSRLVLFGALSGLVSCAGGPPRQAPVPAASAREIAAPALVQEEHLADIRQLTHGGENAEAYWSFDGAQLILQARPPTSGCDRIFRMSVAETAPTPIPVS